MTDPQPTPSAPARRTRARLAAWLVLLPALALVGLALAQPLVSGDLWWHLSTGRWILEHGALPTTDPFSHTAGDRPWILEEYGSQVLFAWIESWGGLVGLRVFGTLLGLALLLAVRRWARRALDPAWASLATVLFALVFALKWELRPQLLSGLLFLFLAERLFPRARRGPEDDPGPRTWLVVYLVTALWVQLHAEALFAPLFAAAGLIGAAFAAGLGCDGGARRIRAWVATLLAAVAGNLSSPFGAAPIVYALFHRSVPQQYIEEWFRPWIAPGDPRFAPLTLGVFVAFLVCAAVGGAFVLAQARRRLRGRSGPAALSWERIGFLALCLVLSLQARRFLFLAWFPAIDGLALLLARRPRLAASSLPALLGALALALPLARSHYVALGRGALERGDFGAVTDARLFPLEAERFLREAGIRGNLYHPYEWGGFLGWWLWPDLRPFIDGRTVLFADVIPERWRAERDPVAAREVFARRDVRAIVMRRLVDHGSGVYAWRPPSLESGAAWIRGWSDARVVVWLRGDDPENLQRMLDHWAAQGVELDAQEGFNECVALAAHPEWLDERELLPALAADRVRGTWSLAGGGHIERAAIFEELRMRRLARWERERAREGGDG